MADVIRNPALIQCIQSFGLTPEEFRMVMASSEQPAPPRDPDMQALLNYLADVLPSADIRGEVSE